MNELYFMAVISRNFFRNNLRCSRGEIDKRLVEIARRAQGISY